MPARRYLRLHLHAVPDEQDDVPRLRPQPARRRIRLEELVLRWTDQDVLAEIEKFQNQFMIQEKEFDAIKDQIAMHEKNMAAHYEKNEDVLNKMFVNQHLALREVLETERNLYHNLKKDFFRFMTKYM